LFKYACALRTHHLDDATIVDRMMALGLTRPAASQFIEQMNNVGWTADSNSRATGIGWLSILLAVGVTGASAFFLSNHLAVSLGVAKVIFVLPFVVLGFVVHVGFAKLLERAGIHVVASNPIPIPDEDELRRIIAAAQKDSASREGNV
jgi:hypothetical protein